MIRRIGIDQADRDRCGSAHCLQRCAHLSGSAAARVPYGFRAGPVTSGPYGTLQVASSFARLWYWFGKGGGDFLFSVLGQLAEADPDRPALTCGDVTLTRAEFVQRVERLAALFAGCGVVEGSTVTIGLPNSIGLVESLFAAWAVDAVPQPISGRLPPLERSAIVDLASPSLVVGMPQSVAGVRPAMESVPRQLPAGSLRRACRRCGSSLPAAGARAGRS